MTAEVRRLSEALIRELSAPIDPRSVPVRFSRLRSMGISPAHYWHAVQEDRPDTLAMRLGRGVHSLLLDQPDRVVVFRGKTRQGKVWDAFEAAATGANQEVLNEREHSVALGIANAVRRHSEASRLLFDGTIMESRIEWTFMNRACQSTPDAFGRHGLVELKTCRTANPDQFVRSATFMKYHAQLAFYRAALNAAGLAAPSEAFIVAVESLPPHPVTVLRLTERALDYGDRTVRLLFERLLVCESTNEWPGYVQSTVDFDVQEDPIDELVFGEERDDA